MSKQRILFVYNTGEYLLRLRRELLIELLDAGHEVFALFPFDDATPELEHLGVGCVNLSMVPHSLRLRCEISTLIDLRKQLRGIGPDIIFAFTIKPIVYTGLTISRAADVRFFVMITGLGMMFAGHGLKGWLARRIATALYRRSLPKADVVFMQNKEHAQAFVELNLVSPSQIELIAGSGVNLDRFVQHPIPDKPPVFLLLTRMLEHKGVRVFIDAAAKYQSSGRAAEFILAGPLVKGPHAIGEVDLDQLLKDSQVTYIGQVDDVPELLKRATIVVLPSVYPEGVPRILLEALAVGRPVITTDTPGCRTTVAFSDADSCNNAADNPVTWGRGHESAAKYGNLTSGSTRPTAIGPAVSQNADGGNRIDSKSDYVELSDIHGKAGLNGVLCRPVCADALFNCMVWMGSLSPRQLQQMGDVGRDLVQRRFDVREVNRKILDRLLRPDRAQH